MHHRASRDLPPFGRGAAFDGPSGRRSFRLRFRGPARIVATSSVSARSCTSGGTARADLLILVIIFSNRLAAMCHFGVTLRSRLAIPSVLYPSLADATRHVWRRRPILRQLHRADRLHQCVLSLGHIGDGRAADRWRQTGLRRFCSAEPSMLAVSVIEPP